ncbi:hypothetical protein R3P38DRAFT_3232840 [Favolaschia claudopus]|uniref:CCHC-type domain-containing protein n=1 Tax=Favolaschia claudopus TaxID=2862362 RepID=A0AAV9ZI67_9AGAR
MAVPSRTYHWDMRCPWSAIRHSPGDQAEEFQAMMDRKITALVDKQLGQALELPARIKPPKLATPDPFSGEKNDSDDFMLFAENVTTWMRAQFWEDQTWTVTDAQDWFLDYVEGRHGPPTVPNNLTAILCALHRRFITFNTAQRASKAFEAVRYRPDDGPTKLMDDLLSASRKMVEPMSDFMIRRQFFKLLPSQITNFLLLVKGMLHWPGTLMPTRVEQGAIATILPRSMSKAVPSTAIRRAPPSRTVRPAPSHRDQPNPSTSTQAAKTSDQSPHAHKRCFKCGGSGHIASDKICPQFGTPNPPRVGLASNRVLDSYAEEDYPIDETGDSEELVDDNWGGSQYDDGSAEEDHEHGNADLADLIDFDQEVEARVGAMQLHYYSQRIVLPPRRPESDSVIQERADWINSLTPLQARLAALSIHYYVRDADELFGGSSIADVDRLDEYRQEEEGLPEFTVDERLDLRRELVLAHYYPVDRYSSFGMRLATHLEPRVKNGAYFSYFIEPSMCEVNSTPYGSSALSQSPSRPMYWPGAPQALQALFRRISEGLEEAEETRIASTMRKIPLLGRLSLNKKEEIQTMHRISHLRSNLLTATSNAEDDVGNPTSADPGTPSTPPPEYPIAGQIDDSPPSYRPPVRYTFQRGLLSDSGRLIVHPALESSFASSSTAVTRATGTDEYNSEAVPTYYPRVATNENTSDDDLWAGLPDLTEDEHAAAEAPEPVSISSSSSGIESQGSSSPTPDTVDETVDDTAEDTNPTESHTTSEESGGDPETELHLLYARVVEDESIEPRETSEYRWENIPGIWNEPSNPDEEPGAAQLWIRGRNYDFQRGFVHYLNTGVTSSPSSDDIREPQDSDELVLRTLVNIMGTPFSEWETYLTRPQRDSLHSHPTMRRYGKLHATPPRLGPLRRMYGVGLRWRKPRVVLKVYTTAEGILTLSPAFYREPRTMTSSPVKIPSSTTIKHCPGFRAQALSQRIEHVARIRRIDSQPSVSINEQPSRKPKDIACLTAELMIGSSKAYVLFDSGSNTDSLTPEYARAAGCRAFKLSEQVTLQLGCVGSRARINFGTRAEVDFGGIRGHAYFDIVNLDRYDAVIGTPFMAKHGLCLDFGKREIRFPNWPRRIRPVCRRRDVPTRETGNSPPRPDHRTGCMDHGRSVSLVTLDEDVEHPQSLPTLPPHCPYLLMSEVEYLQFNHRSPEHRPVTVVEIDDIDDYPSLPSLPWEYPFVLELESAFMTGVPPWDDAPIVDDFEPLLEEVDELDDDGLRH